MNLTLALASLPLLLWSLALCKDHVGTRPGSLMAAFFWLLGVSGSRLWMWSRDAHGAGLPSTIAAEPFGRSQAATALLLAAFGSVVGALCMTHVSVRAAEPRAKATVTAPRLDLAGILANQRLPAMLAGLETAGLVLWLIGQGPNIWHREQYLETQGPAFLVRATGIPCSILVLAGVATLVLAPRRPHRNTGRIILVILTLVWTASFIAKGTRMSAIIPLLAAICLFAPSARRGRALSTRLVLACGCLLSSLVFFSAAYAARSGAGGYDQLGRMLGVGWDEASSGESLRRMVASVAAAFPIVEHSIDVAVPWDIIAQNSNPLPGTAAAPGAELYMPFTWVPLAIVGELYGAIGGLGTALVYFGIALVLGSTSRRLAISRIPYLYLLPLILGAGFAVLSVEYPSRRFWRLVSIAALIFVISLLLKKHPNSRLAGGARSRDELRDQNSNRVGRQLKEREDEPSER